ncbi:ABC transporter substrate-binding protein [Archangium violaceum]|uniref:ABC transporter substrate-binding protein n=1 Tax=Archangium violaceum TaxID=83451 RepID=UPI002B2B1706|nr:ABC transporter substrate-binding protein [Archangium gephyra]
MNARLRSLTLLATLAFALPALAAPNEPVAKPVKTVVQSVRYSKDDIALKQLANEEQGRFLLGEDWEKGTDAQRKEFTKLFHSLFAKIAFPKVRENFKNLASITYDDPAVEGDKANVKSTVVIEHPLKKQEMKLQYIVVKSQGGWKVLDVAVLGDSMLTGIRDDQVQPILKQGGWDKLLELMRAKEAELSKK